MVKYNTELMDKDTTEFTLENINELNKRFDKARKIMLKAYKAIDDLHREFNSLQFPVLELESLRSDILFRSKKKK